MDELPLPWPLGREEWRGIDDHPGYEVSSEGRVRSWRARTGCPLVMSLVVHPKGGYPSVRLKTEDPFIARTRYVHRLVAKTFIGDSDGERYQVRHIDGDPTNNTINNLCWGTPKENAADRKFQGTHTEGERHSVAKLTASQVAEIAALLLEGRLSQPAIANMFGVRKHAITCIKLGRNWRSVTGFAFVPKGRRGVRRELQVA